MLLNELISFVGYEDSVLILRDLKECKVHYVHVLEPYLRFHLVFIFLS
jgi:hypothetical protein